MKTKKKQKLSAPIKQIEQYLNDGKLAAKPNMKKKLCAFFHKVRRYLDLTGNGVSNFENEVYEYFKSSYEELIWPNNMLYLNYVFDLNKLKPARDGIKKQRDSVTEFKKNLENKLVKSDKTQWLTDLDEFLYDYSIVSYKMNAKIGRVNSRPRKNDNGEEF